MPRIDAPGCDQPSVLDEIAARSNLPPIKAMIRLIATAFRDRVTLLAVCPNSEAVVRAALGAAMEANAPILFAATLNQVDTDHGYTGWTPDSFTSFLEYERRKLDSNLPVLACLDHGGPWLKDRHVLDEASFDVTMTATRKSIEACLDAGYALLHIDATVDRTLPHGTPLSIDQVVDRTLQLIEHAETYRSEMGHPAVSYEVGTEEVHGGLADATTFDHFLAKLDVGLRRLGMEDAFPSLVVGKIGTDLHTTSFDVSIARDLTAKVRTYGALIKGHYSDYVDHPQDYPLSGIGAANVGPEFTEEEFLALGELVDLERRLGKSSGFDDALRDAVEESGRWKKWLNEDERGRDFADLSQDRRGWLLRTGARYVWTAQDVLEARSRLYHNVRDHRDADAFVVWRIRRAILKYYHAFNLVDFNDRLIKALPSLQSKS